MEGVRDQSWRCMKALGRFVGRVSRCPAASRPSIFIWGAFDIIWKATVHSEAILLSDEQWSSDRHNTGGHVGDFCAFSTGLRRRFDIEFGKDEYILLPEPSLDLGTKHFSAVQDDPHRAFDVLGLHTYFDINWERDRSIPVTKMDCRLRPPRIGVDVANYIALTSVWPPMVVARTLYSATQSGNS